ncbi:MAG: cytochrome d ubiquinol oxidase subunit II [Cellvibrionaceae bacterium]|nr:cytochrome d ubiquinol oxidase subunit II [Cellvibrionaceae bacterium]
MNLLGVLIDPNYLGPIFIGLMALAVLVYAILDGYDLGVGIVLHRQDEAMRDTQIASIGPFWDANETWLVLAIGLMLIAFPEAYNILLQELYVPATIMLGGLILRGVAFDFRAKVAMENKNLWDHIFRAGSLIVALSQGYMLGQYICGFSDDSLTIVFSLLSAFGVAAAYSYIGSCWLVMKTEGELQKYSAKAARLSGLLMALGIASVCIVNPWINPEVYDRWFSFPNNLLLWVIPIISAAIFLFADQVLKRVPAENDYGCWIPFVLAVVLFLNCFQGIVVSFYPDVIPGRLSLYDAVAAPEALGFIFWGAVIVVPVILAYTAYSYRVFWGKATALRYF